MSPSITLSVLSKHQRAEGSGWSVRCRVEVHLATDHADVGSLERTISAALVEVGVQLWRELVTRLEVALPVPLACAACGGAMKANGRAPRRLVTLAGEVELRRQRYRCRDCGTEVVPLDAVLGLEPRTARTLGVRERGLWLVTEMRAVRHALDRTRRRRRRQPPLPGGQRPPGGGLGAHPHSDERGLNLRTYISVIDHAPVVARH